MENRWALRGLSMANWLLCVDSDDLEREAMKARIESRIAPVPGLSIRSLDVPGGFVVWAEGPQAADVSQIPERTAIVWGRPHDRGKPADAASLATSRNEPRLPAFDGYFASVVVDDSGVCVLGDVLGLSPIYYWHEGERLLVGSSAALFSEHPLFNPRVDVTSLVAVLLMMHPIDGRSIYAGVSRLGAGRSLHWTPGKATEEHPHFELPLTQDEYDLPFAGHVDNLDLALKAALGRQAPTGVLLSGGLDSRLIAGYARRDGVLSSSFTLGLPSDRDRRFASKVAASLSLRAHYAEVPPEEFPDCARLSARWEHAQNGFSTLYEWKLAEPLARFANFAANGFVMDAVAGGSHIAVAYDRNHRTMGFDPFWRYLNRSGLRPEAIREMGKTAEVRDAVDWVVGRVKELFESAGESASHHAYAFDLKYRQRFHVARGSWVTSFGSWPMMPVLDRDLLAVTGGIPAASLADRRCESAVLVRVFPRLAHIPLDRNRGRPDPLLPRFRHELVRHVTTRLGGRAIEAAFSVRDPRRYMRVFDVNNAGWRAIRREAEPFRHILHDWFDAESLARHWPEPDVQVTEADVIAGTAGMKNLMGLALCVGQW
jgi:asparagine synthase (glutamine-hydrolysing)